MTAREIRQALWGSREARIAMLALGAIASHLVLRYALPHQGSILGPGGLPLRDLPLLAGLALGGAPLLWTLLRQALRREFGSDLLAGISIVTALLLGEYLAGTLVVLMLSGGQALEAFAVRSASSVLEALAKRMPAIAHRRRGEAVEDIPLDEIAVGDQLVVFPHEICPVDAEVEEGHGSMDESYLTGEPYRIEKTPGSNVLSGAVNGDSVLTVRAIRRAIDSRYSKIMEVMRASEQRRPRLRRLGDQLGAIYTPLAVALAVAAWVISGERIRFLAVLVVATPCPLLIGIPVAIIGSISLAAKRGIIIKDPAVLERISTCRTAIFDKTGTLTYGQPQLTEVVPLGGFTADAVLADVASLERYSRHPLSGAILKAAQAKALALSPATAISERAGEGLTGTVAGRTIRVGSRSGLARESTALAAELPAAQGGLECVIRSDDRPAALLRFRDAPRQDGARFIRHLEPQHRFERVLLVSGDREDEVRYLAEQVGIREVYFSQTPEQKVEITRAETERAPTLFMGDGINDAPALATATVGIAFGQNSDVTSEAAGAVILDSSLGRVDELLHIGRRMRSIALISAVGGMALSVIGMALAAAGWLSPVAGAIAQEAIDIAAVFQALRAAWPPKTLSDY